MRKIKTDFQLLLALASYHVGLISTKVIDQLMLLKNGFLLSGDDSGLKNTWEEICIQVQGEESIHWDVYSDAIRNFITDELTKQTESIQILLSYIGGIESDIRIEEDEDCYAFIQEYAVKEILENILMTAKTYENESITRFLADDFADEENDKEDEDGKEDI